MSLTLQALKKLERLGAFTTDRSLSETPNEMHLAEPPVVATATLETFEPLDLVLAKGDRFCARRHELIQEAVEADHEIPAIDTAEISVAEAPADQCIDASDSAMELLDRLETAAREFTDDFRESADPWILPDGQESAPTAEIEPASATFAESESEMNGLETEYTPFYQPVIEPMLEVETVEFAENPTNEAQPIEPQPFVVAESVPPADHISTPVDAAIPPPHWESGPLDKQDLEHHSEFTRKATDGQSPSNFERTIFERFSNVSYERTFDQLQNEIFKRTGETTALTVAIVAPRSTPHTANLVGHLGVALASKGQNQVLIVDANETDRHLSTQFEHPAAAGFLDLCADTDSLSALVLETSVRSLNLLACGEPRPESAEASKTTRRSLGELIHSFRNHFPCTFIDGGGLQSATTQQLVEHAAATVLLITIGETTQPETDAAIQRIDSLGGNLIGCVIAGAYKPTT